MCVYVFGYIYRMSPFAGARTEHAGEAGGIDMRRVIRYSR